jgi:hypothetical protein
MVIVKTMRAAGPPISNNFALRTTRCGRSRNSCAN